jgi:hypothetical protein
MSSRHTSVGRVRIGRIVQHVEQRTNAWLRITPRSELTAAHRMISRCSAAPDLRFVAKLTASRSASGGEPDQIRAGLLFVRDDRRGMSRPLVERVAFFSVVAYRS